MNLIEELEAQMRPAPQAPLAHQAAATVISSLVGLVIAVAFWAVALAIPAVMFWAMNNVAWRHVYGWPEIDFVQAYLLTASLFAFWGFARIPIQLWAAITRREEA